MATNTEDFSFENKELEKFYKYLYAQRGHILAKFNDENISDDEYLKSGIAYDIVNNSLSIILNVAFGHKNSIGIDSCARTIIEAFVIREIDEKGLINDDMKKIYRLSYSAVEADNERRFDEADAFNPDEEQRKKDFDELIRLVCQRFNCTRKQLLNSYALHDPYLFLLRTLDDKTNFVSLTKTYHIDTDKFNDAYTFFSIMIHPKQLTGDEVEELRPTREKYLKTLFDYIIDFVTNDLEHVEYDKVVSFKSRMVLLEKTFLAEERRGLGIFDKFMHLLSPHDPPLIPFYLTILINLWSDMLICYYFSLYDLVTPKYKAFIEESSVLLHFLKIPPSEEKDIQLRAFFLGTYYRLQKWLPENKDKVKEIEDFVQEAYSKHYGKAYSVNGINGFKTNLKEQLLYFIRDKNYSLWDLVRDEHKSSGEEGFSKNICTLYDVALDMQHASGYVFNQSADEAEYYAAWSLYYLYDFLRFFLAGIDGDMKEHNVNLKGFSEEIKYLGSLMDKYLRRADQIAKRNKT